MYSKKLREFPVHHSTANHTTVGSVHEVSSRLIKCSRVCVTGDKQNTTLLLPPTSSRVKPFPVTETERRWSIKMLASLLFAQQTLPALVNAVEATNTRRGTSASLDPARAISKQRNVPW